MEWTEQKYVMLVREILSCESFKFKAGSKERGSAWSQIAQNLKRAVRDRYVCDSFHKGNQK